LLYYILHLPAPPFFAPRSSIPTHSRPLPPTPERRPDIYIYGSAKGRRRPPPPAPPLCSHRRRHRRRSRSRSRRPCGGCLRQRPPAAPARCREAGHHAAPRLLCAGAGTGAGAGAGALSSSSSSLKPAAAAAVALPPPPPPGQPRHGGADPGAAADRRGRRRCHGRRPGP
jgi:hypothetical protein